MLKWREIWNIKYLTSSWSWNIFKFLPLLAEFISVEFHLIERKEESTNEYEND